MISFNLPKFQILKVTIVLILFCNTAFSAEIRVGAGQAYTTIQSAIDIAGASDVIVVEPGTYYEALSFKGIDITIRSTNPEDPATVAATIIDATGQETSVVTFSGDETAACVLAGFTITHGNAEEDSGGGIDGAGCEATIRYNTIAANRADEGAGLAFCHGLIEHNRISDNVGTGTTYVSGRGGGLYSCGGTIQYNEIVDNTVKFDGGGLIFCSGVVRFNLISGNRTETDDAGALANCYGVIENNQIVENFAKKNAGGLYSCSGTIRNNLIARNECEWRGGGLSECRGRLENNTIVDNEAGKECGGAYKCTGQMINCIFWGNTALETISSQVASDVQLYLSSTPLHSCIQDWTDTLYGNISSSPQLLADGYHLSAGSPCIDQGNFYYFYSDPCTDIDGEVRIYGPSIDMGCDEYGSLPDSDGDLLADTDEAGYNCDINLPDTDGDGLYDGVEVMRQSNPALSTDPDLSVGMIVPSTGIELIQQAIFLAGSPETITVQPGTYQEYLNYLGKDLVVQSTDPQDEDVVSATIIDAASASSVVTFEGTETEAAALRGLTIKHGKIEQSGGGVSGNGTLATIEYNRILSNYAESSGGGINDCDGLIQYNLISRNRANSSQGYGGGISSAGGIVRYNTITDNYCGHHGGGIASSASIVEYNLIDGNYAAHMGGGVASCSGIIRNNRITNNSTVANGGGLYSCDYIVIFDNLISGNYTTENRNTRGGGALYDCHGIFRNNTIVNNHTAGMGGALNKCNALMVNCIFWGNTSDLSSEQFIESSTPYHSCIEGWSGTFGNSIGLNPSLTTDGHLQSDSPCIDSGDPSYLYGDYLADIDGQGRLAGTTIDIGCDEYDSSTDQDSDLIVDSEEANFGADPAKRDTDGDGLLDGVEVLRMTAPDTPNTLEGITVPSGIFDSIQKAIFLALEGETITVDEGIYSENLLIPGKNLILQGSDPLNDQVVSATIIQGGSNYSCITLGGIEGATSAIRGLTLTGGRYQFGGGINGEGSQATIEYNRIINNEAIQWYGGGIDDCNGLIQHNLVSNNISDGGGGGISQCHGTIRDNTVTLNSTYGFVGTGGGLFRCSGLVENNVISNNWTEYSSSDGGGLYACNGVIRGNTITGNHVDSSYSDGGGLSECDALIEANLVSGNSTPDRGGGLYDCNGIIRNCTIAANIADNGGGIYGGNGSVVRNWIHDNQADFGGGLYACGGWVAGNLIYSNVADSTGGGLYGCSGDLVNNTIYGNTAGLDVGGIYDCDGDIVNCIIWGNITTANSAQLVASSTPKYCCIEDWQGPGICTTNHDPLFIDGVSGDFHLSRGSCCIDAGCWIEDVTQDMDRSIRPYQSMALSWADGSGMDIGAYEYNGPGLTRGEMLMLFTPEWFNDDQPGSFDLVPSGQVDENDMLELERRW